jgi:hypothetical protein
MNLIKMLASMAITWFVVMLAWTANYYQMLLAYNRKELGIFPMIELNNSFDTWSTAALIIGAVIGVAFISQQKAA